MPCRSDYLEASRQEKDSRKFCGLLCYVLEAIDVEPPDWALKAKDEYYGDAAKVNDAVVLLCMTIRKLTPEQMDRIVYDGRNPQARALADFWDAHTVADKRREREERERSEREHSDDEKEYERLKAKLGKP